MTVADLPPPKLVQPGVSLAALSLKSFVGKIAAHMNLPVTVPRNYLLGQIFQVLRSCSKAGWDGENALAIKGESVAAVEEFVKRIPHGMPAPDVVPEIAGTIALEWRKSNDKILVLSFTGKRTLIYAGILGGGEVVHGTKPFLGSIPGEIHELILENFA